MRGVSVACYEATYDSGMEPPLTACRSTQWHGSAGAPGFRRSGWIAVVALGW